MFKEGNPFTEAKDDLLDDPRRAEYLTDRDLETIKTGMQMVWDKYNRLPAKELPGSIIFTETSARPFAYLFKPLFDKLSALKGQGPPSLGFILTDSDSELGYELFKKGFDWDKWTRQRTETNKDHIAWLEESIAEYKRDLEEYDKTGKVERMDEPGVAWPWMEQGRDYFLENISSYEDSLAKAEDLPTKLKACWKGILQRIRSEAERQRAEGKKPRILFVDEQVYGAGTLRLIEAACREVKRLIPDLKAEYFTFMDSRVDVDEGQERGFRRSLGKRYLAVPTPRAYEGFRFREHGDKEPVIGVTKTLGEPTVRRSAVRDAEKMAYLRNLLRQIGEEFVESLGT